jgi:uncharacterized membrane protein YczE
MLFIQFIFGLLIKTLGLALIIRSHLGTGAWEALYIGVPVPFREKQTFRHILDTI